MKILIIGIGAIGGWLAGALAHEDVTLFARGDTVKALRKLGLILIENGEQRIYDLPVIADSPLVTGLVSQEEMDYIILTTKTQNTAEALARVNITPQTKVIYAQNGLPPWFMGEATRGIPVAGVIHASTSVLEPGVIEIHKAEKIILGSPVACDLTDLAVALEFGGIKTQISQDIRLDIWAKLWGNMSMNPLSALTRLTATPLMANRETRGLLEAIMQEHVTLGHALGLILPISVPERLAMAEKLGDFKTSSLRDIERGQPMELEGLLGDLLNLATLNNVEMPASRMVYQACVGLNLSLSQ